MNEKINEPGLMDTISVDREGGEPVNAKVRLSSGKLAISGGAANLCSGTLKYADEVWKPEVSYHVEENMGELLITPPLNTLQNQPKSQYDWDVAFADEVPLALALQVGSGSTHLHIQDSMLTKLTCEIGSGPLDMGLLGTLAELEQLRLLTGSGPINAILNGIYAKLVNLKIATGSGSVDLALGGEFPALENMKLATASGQLNIGLSGSYDHIQSLKMDTASGNINLNLDNLKSDLSIKANCVSGNFIIRYPANMGVALKATTLSGKYQADGFTRKQGEYVNALYGEADVNVRIKFAAVSGNLRLQPSEV